MKHIYDPSFRYTPSHDTNLRATFDRLRRDQSHSDSRGRADAKASAVVTVLHGDYRSSKTAVTPRGEGDIESARAAHTLKPA